MPALRKCDILSPVYIVRRRFSLLQEAETPTKESQQRLHRDRRIGGSLLFALLHAHERAITVRAVYER